MSDLWMSVFLCLCVPLGLWVGLSELKLHCVSVTVFNQSLIVCLIKFFPSYRKISCEILLFLGAALPRSRRKGHPVLQSFIRRAKFLKFKILLKLITVFLFMTFSPILCQNVLKIIISNSIPCILNALRMLKLDVFLFLITAAVLALARP